MIKKNDFIEIEFTGIIKESNQVFDTTSEEVAKKEKMHNPEAKYNPIIICVGQGQLVKGLDEQLEGKELKEYEIEIEPEKAFGRKNPKLLKILSTSSFKKQNLTPYPGLQVNIDGFMGIIRTVTGGRTIVDFNHPLSGRTLIYKIKINKLVTDKKSQIDSLISTIIRDPKIEIKEDTAHIKAKLLPQEEIQKELVKKIKELTNIKNVTILKE
jgi:FKBP-type peptidyl-prolyl cis-trans isomerase 2